MRRETRRESFNVELPEMEKLWLLREERKKRKIAWKILLCILVASLVAGFVTAVVKSVERHHDHKQPPPPAVNYTLALHKALSFFEAQRSGKLPDGNKVSWRGDSCLQDGNYSESVFKDLVGGYYDGGDATKSSFPMSFSMTMLSWSVIEYSAKYQASGELNHVKELIKWGTDYFLKTFDSSADAIAQIVVQVGSPNDHYCWMRPEDIDYQRQATQCFVRCPDVAAEMAASLASASIVFKDDTEYSHKLLQGAKTSYKFADSMRDRKTDSSKFDELIWGATWMYYATGDVTYLDRATSHTLADRAGSSYVFSWDKKLVGAQLLLTRLRLFLGPGYPYEEVLSLFHAQISRVMCSYLPYFTTFNRTEGGLIQLNHGDPQPLQYAANAAFLAKLYSDYLEESLIPGWYCGHTLYRTQVLRDFSTSQVDYILGNNPRNMSYVVGYGEQYPKHIHHRGASIPPNQKESCKGGWKWRDTQDENPNTIDGAMVAGPDKEGGFRDLRADYNEPSLAGNAGLVAALLALSEASGGIDKNTMFSVVPPLYPATPPPPAPWTP